MRILVVGAGAVGGYFGARLVAAQRDVTFLVRAARERLLAQTGLVVHSPLGDLHLQKIQTVTEQTLGHRTFDLILLCCKAYDLQEAMNSIAGAVGPQTLLVPLLNGMHHLQELQQRFGKTSTLGGVCEIGSTLNEQGAIVHLNHLHTLTIGEVNGHLSERLVAAAAALGVASCHGHSSGFDANVSDNIVALMWNKWVYLSSLAAATCLFRAPLGDILDTPDGPEFMERLFEECCSVALHSNHALSAEAIDHARTMLFARGSPMTSSMLRDVMKGSCTEAAHVLGDLLSRGLAFMGPGQLPMLSLAYSNLLAYEAQRKRQ